MTTPNVEYNVRYEGLRSGMRHPDHRFEWTRDEFAAWSDRVAASATATASSGAAIGDARRRLGPPTQMAIFTRSEADDD